MRLIQTQVRSNAESEDIKNLTTNLSVVCKDHNNVVMQDLIDDSHRFIYAKALAECFRDDDDPLIEESRAEAHLTILPFKIAKPLTFLWLKVQMT